MTCNTESDATYCSEIEKKEQTIIRRSKRLSQRNFLPYFRSNGDPLNRLYDIYQTLKCGELSSIWKIDDWKALKVEVDLIQKSLKGKQKGRIAFILKKIDKNLQKKNPKESTNASCNIEINQNDEQVKSPNILAGMMTEALSEIPPYQPKNVTENVNSRPNIGLTQKNPLDLTKKNFEPPGPQKGFTQQTSESEKPHPGKTITPTRGEFHRVLNSFDTLGMVNSRVLAQGTSEPHKQQSAKTPTQTRDNLLKQQQKISNLSVSKDSMIDLTDENPVESDKENVPPVIRERTAKPKSPLHVSKWIQFLPTQQRPKLPENRSEITTKNSTTTLGTTVVSSTATKKSKSFKDSITKLYRDRPVVTKSYNSNSIQKQTSKSKRIHQKPNSSPIKPQTNQTFSRPYRNTESIIPRPPSVVPSPRNVQSENIGVISQDFLLDEFLDLNESDMNESETSLTPSLKEDFKKLFGTDKLSDIFGSNDVVYELKEHHVTKLATVLKIEVSVLKKTIEDILSNKNLEMLEDDNIRSDSSVVECSQSPPHRLFPSQRSQDPKT